MNAVSGPQVMYLASMIRCVLALHNLIDNKEQRLWKERKVNGKAVAASEGTKPEANGAA